MDLNKGIKQSEGNVQVALQNSDNNQITIIQTPQEYIRELITMGKIDEAVLELKKTVEMFQNMHPLSPYYRYKPIHIGNTIVFDHEPIDDAILEKYPLTYKGAFSFRPDDIQTDETLEQYMIRKWISQESINIDMKYIQTWIGDQEIDNPHSLENYAVKEGDWKITPKKLPPPLKAKVNVIDRCKTKSVLNYVELSLSELNWSNNTISISNENQKHCPVFIFFTVPNFLNEKVTSFKGFKATFNFKLRDSYKGTVSGELAYLNFVKELSSSKHIEVVEIMTNKPIFSANIAEVDIGLNQEKIESRGEFLNKLKLIEEKLHITFHIPDNIDDEDIENIEVLTCIAIKKPKNSKFNEFNITANSIDSTNEVIKAIGYHSKVLQGEYTLSKTIEVFGAKVEGVKIWYKFNNVLIKDVERLKNKLLYVEHGEPITITCKPGKKNTLSTYYKL